MHSDGNVPIAHVWRVLADLEARTRERIGQIESDARQFNRRVAKNEAQAAAVVIEAQAATDALRWVQLRHSELRSELTTPENWEDLP